MAQKYLEANGVSEIEMIDIEAEPSKRAEMLEKSGGRQTVPQIFINGFHIGGCDDLKALPLERLKELLGK